MTGKLCNRSILQIFSVKLCKHGQKRDSGNFLNPLFPYCLYKEFIVSLLFLYLRVPVSLPFLLVTSHLDCFPRCFPCTTRVGILVQNPERTQTILTSDVLLSSDRPLHMYLLNLEDPGESQSCRSDSTVGRFFSDLRRRELLASSVRLAPLRFMSVG